MASSASAPPGHTPPIKLAQSLRHLIQRTYQPSFRITIADDAYSYKIAQYHCDPDDMFSNFIVFANKMSDLRQTPFTLPQVMVLIRLIDNSLVDMVYGSNLIENAGCSPRWLTEKISGLIFHGQEVPEEIDETGEEYEVIKQYLERSQLPADTAAIAKSRREIVQHAKAAAYMIDELVMKDQDLSEEIIRQTHSILTHRIDAPGTPWSEYSGVYRTQEVSAGLQSFPHPTVVPYKMKSMILDFKSELKQAEKTRNIDPIAFASKYAQKFVNIHPFIDGNGRTCRLILNALLLKYGCCLVCIGKQEFDRLIYRRVAANGSVLETMYEDAEEDEKPQPYKELASFVLHHVRNSMRILATDVEQAGWRRTG